MHQISTTLTLTVVGSPRLYDAVRAGFINQGTSLNRWCIANQVNRQTAQKALMGITGSKNARDLVQRLVEAALEKSRANG